MPGSRQIPMNCKDWQQSMMKPVAGLIVLLTAVAMASDVDAKRNPPGCQNANAAAHNPNCQGGGSTHVTVPSPQPTTNVQTIVVTPAATQSGGGLTSNTPKPQAPVVVKPSPQQTYTGHSPYYVPPDPPAQQTPQPMTQVAPPQLFSNTAPALKPGFQKFPTWQGKRDPATGYPVPPNPPAQQTPQPMTQVAPPQPSPQAKPQLVPNQIVTASPQQTYTGYSPHFVGAPLTVGQTSSSQSTQKQILMHIQNSATQNPGTSFIPPKPGRNFIEGYRAYYVDRNSVLSACVLSGLGKRTTKNQVNAEWSVGHSETLHFRSTSTAHLPSNRAHASHHCLVTVNKSPVR
jgi:hypothetical protein